MSLLPGGRASYRQGERNCQNGGNEGHRGGHDRTKGRDLIEERQLDRGLKRASFCTPLEPASTSGRREGLPQRTGEGGGNARESKNRGILMEGAALGEFDREVPRRRSPDLLLFEIEEKSVEVTAKKKSPCVIRGKIFRVGRKGSAALLVGEAIRFFERGKRQARSPIR